MDYLLGRAKYFISISVRTIMFNFLTLFLFPLFPMFQFRCAASPVGQAAGKRINRDHRARCRLWNFQVKTDHSENIWLPTEWRNSQKKEKTSGVKLKTIVSSRYVQFFRSMRIQCKKLINWNFAKKWKPTWAVPTRYFGFTNEFAC